MKKILILLILLWSSACLAGSGGYYYAGQTVAGGGGGCESCNSGNDGYVAENPNVANTVTGNSLGYAWEFTIGSEQCITGVEFEADDNGGSVTITCEIWSDSSGPNEIVGAGYTGSVAVPDTAETKAEALFAATQTLSAGTYYAYCQPDGEVDWANDDDGVGTYYYTANGGTSFSSSSSRRIISVLGCAP